MLLYLTLLIIALALAVGIIWFYRATTDTSKAIYTTILPDNLESRPADHLKQAAGQESSRVVKDPWGQKQHATPANVAKTNAAVPAEKTPWGWPNDGQHANSPHSTRHCSLYESPVTDPARIREQNVGWPYREDIPDRAGTAYKVSRKKTRAKKKTNADLKTVSKPWGW